MNDPHTSELKRCGEAAGMLPHETVLGAIMRIVRERDPLSDLKKEILTATDGRYGGAKHEVLCVLGEIAVLKAYSKPPFKDALFTGVVLTEKGWRRTSHYSASPEKAMLDTMGYKHGGPNSQFGNFASRALGI